MPSKRNDPPSLFPLEAGIFFLVFAGCILFGAVYSWVFMSLSAIIFLLLFLYPDSLLKVFCLPKSFLVGIAFVFSFLLFQLFKSSLNTHGTGQELLKWLAYAAGFLLIQLLPLQTINRLLYSILYLGVLESLYGLVQVHSKWEMVLWHSKSAYQGFVTGTYFNRNHFAGLLELCLGVHLGLWLEAFYKRKSRHLVFLSILLIFSLLGILQSSSRVGIISFLSALLLLTFLFVLKKEKVGFPPVCILTFFFIFALLVSWDVVMPRFLELKKDWLTGKGRFLAWQNTFVMLREHWKAGIGLGAFEWVFPFYQSEKLLKGWSHLHNDYLELAVSLGIPCFVIFILSFSVLIGRSFKMFLVAESPLFIRMWGLWVGVAAFLFHSFTDFNLAIPANGMLFIFVLAMIYRLLSLGEGVGGEGKQ